MSYIHYFMYLDSDLNMIEISEPFVFERSGIEFAINLVLDGDAILISYGVADRRARVLRIPAERVADLIAVS